MDDYMDKTENEEYAKRELEKIKKTGEKIFLAIGIVIIIGILLVFIFRNQIKEYMRNIPGVESGMYEFYDENLVDKYEHSEEDN